MKTKIYLVKYSTGSYDDYSETLIFATHEKSKATKYCTKFNGILKKWKTYYSQFEGVKCNIRWLKDEYVNKYFFRWHSLMDINKCVYEIIEIR